MVMRKGIPKAIDLFCGCGGLTVGLKKAGFQILGAVDIDPLSVETYKANHSDVKVWEMDIRRLQPGELLATSRICPSGTPGTICLCRWRDLLCQLADWLVGIVHARAF